MKTTTKLDRLENLRSVLIECKQECLKDADEWNTDEWNTDEWNTDEWNTYNDMMVKVNNLLTEERRKQGWMAVYPIVHGCAQESLFEGTKEQCKIYTDILLEAHPEKKGNIIVLEL